MSGDSLAVARTICHSLRESGADCVFGLPGTQNVALYEALRTSGLRSLVATSELSAAMMANGYYRASGNPGLLLTIPGPGFAWALPGIAEAALDSAAIVHIAGAPATSPGNRYQLQAFDQAAMATPLYKAVFTVARETETGDAVRGAFACSLQGEPGPVLLQVAQGAAPEVSATLPPIPPAPEEVADESVIEAIARDLCNARRCLLLLGQGCQGASGPAIKLAESLRAAVVTTTSGRGAVPEDHPLSLGFAFGGYSVDVLNALIESSDTVLAVGCKFSHNGSRGFGLRIPAYKLIHVDAGPDVLGANYPARITLCAEAGVSFAALLAKIRIDGRQRGFDADELERWRARAEEEKRHEGIEPRIQGMDDASPRTFFDALRQALPRDAILVTDSGQHQELARRHYPVWCARGLITPTNLQSMGFCIGAAIGAKLAQPQRKVVALIGDGGLAMSGLELLTAVRERLDLAVIVFVDGAFGAIRNQQRAAYGHAPGSQLPELDCAGFARAIGARHVRLGDGPEAALRNAIEARGVSLIEVREHDSLPMRWSQAKGHVKKWLGRPD